MENSEETEIRPVVCPFCGSADTEMIALFGMQMMTSQYFCRHCRSAFEAVKWEAPKPEEESQKPERKWPS